MAASEACVVQDVGLDSLKGPPHQGEPREGCRHGNHQQALKAAGNASELRVHEWAKWPGGPLIHPIPRFHAGSSMRPELFTAGLGGFQLLGLENSEKSWHLPRGGERNGRVTHTQRQRRARPSVRGRVGAGALGVGAGRPHSKTGIVPGNSPPSLDLRAAYLGSPAPRTAPLCPLTEHSNGGTVAEGQLMDVIQDYLGARLQSEGCPALAQSEQVGMVRADVYP